MKILRLDIHFKELWAIKKLIVFCISLIFSTSIWAGALPKGYLDSVKDERKIRAVELVLVAKPASDDVMLKELIFDEELRGEFERKYEQEFGHTAIERNVEAPSRYDQFQYTNGVHVTEEEDMARKQRFGEFMVRRLTEHHVDNFIQTNPSTKKIYELKERVSKVKLAVKKGYNLKINYSYSGNTLAFELKNPSKLSNQIMLVMDPQAVGPTNVEETLLRLGYPIANDILLSTHYKFTDGVIDVVGAKPLSTQLTASVTGTTYTKAEGLTERQHRVLFGLTWSN